MPAPINGLNTIDVASTMAPTEALVLYNMVAGEYGVRSRLGYKEYETGLTGNTDNSTRSVIPFTGSKKSGSTNRLFAATSTGIYNVTAGGAVGAKVVTWGVQTGDAGYCSYHVFNTVADRYLVVCDEENGLYVYRESDSTWIQVTQGVGASQISGVNPVNFVHVTVFKNRLWFTQKDTTLGWYLGLNAVFGAANSWDFGPRFRAGGELRGLYNWSYDAGAGIDTQLCAFSGAGDIVIYEGTDPTSVNTFALRGTWYNGGVVRGRRIATDYGGELLVLSALGVVPLSKLTQGISLQDRQQYSSYKISNLFSQLALAYRGNRGWGMFISPSDNLLVVTVPITDGGETFQLAMSLTNKAWSQFGGPNTSCSGWPIISADAWDGQIYFGTADGRVCITRDYVDNAKADGTYSPIQFEVITAFQNLGDVRKKKVNLIRPRFLTQGGALAYNVLAKYDYDMSDIAPPGPALSPVGGSLWDAAKWDVDSWAGDYSPLLTPYGATGEGLAVAAAVRGKLTARTSLIGFDINYQRGRFL